MGRIRSTMSQQQVEQAAYVVPTDIDNVLSNWGRWACARIGGRSNGGHPLGRIALRGRSWDSAPQVNTVVLDAEQAWAVEQCVCNPLFSPRCRALLTHHWALQVHRDTTCRLLHLHWRAYDAEVQKAALYFWDRWQRVQSVMSTATT